MPGAAQSWYREKESAWLHRAVAAAEPEPSRRPWCPHLVTAAEERASCWRRVCPAIPYRFSPAPGARVLSRLLRPMALRVAAWAAGKLPGARLSA